MNTKDLRANLFKQMRKLQDGEVTVKEAKVSAKLSASIIHTIQAEVENKKIEARLIKTIARNIDAKTNSIPTLEI